MRAGSKKLRVVLDTNVLISALGFQGETKKIWDLAEEDRFDLFASRFILKELAKNLVEKADLSPETAETIIEDVRLTAEMVEPRIQVSIITRKESDNRILECAVEAKANVIVTGDMRDIRPLDHFQGIEILTPREFLTKYFPQL